MFQFADARASYAELEDVIRDGPFEIRFPTAADLTQDEEWCEVRMDGAWRRVRFHDYNDVYSIPGLYETIFYRTLRCNSPNTVANLLNEVLSEHGIKPSSLHTLDFGAGNGLSGEALQRVGIRKLYGVDILKEAEMATYRDRPWVYDGYHVMDFTKLTEQDREVYRDLNLNSLVTIAALGFGDIPALAFYNAYNLISEQGLIALNIKDTFFKLGHRSDYSELLTRMMSKEILEIDTYKRYVHRLSISGQPIYYIGLVGKKLRDIPPSLLPN